MPGDIEDIEESEEASGRVLGVLVFSGHDSFRMPALEALAPYYLTEVFDIANVAMEGILARRPSAIVVDMELPPLGGFRFIEKIKAAEGLKNVPILAIADADDASSMEKAKHAPADAYQTRPLLKSKFLEAVSGLANRSVERSWEELPPLQAAVLKETVSIFRDSYNSVREGLPLPIANIEKSCEPMIEAVSGNQFGGILRGVRDHDDYTYVHSLRVSIHLSLLGHAMGIRGRDLKTLAVGGLMHDIGKARVPLEVLNKPARLTDQEWPKMKAHVLHSKKIIERTPDISRGIKAIALQHHEKLNGAGYPYGIKGAELNDLARMASIVDIYGALTDRRAYKPAFSVEKAMPIMLSMKDELDQGLVKLFANLLMDAARQEQ